MSLNPFDTSWVDPKAEEEQPDPPAFPVTNPRPMQRYPHTLPHDIALTGGVEEDIITVLKAHSLTRAEFDYINDLPEFRREVSDWRQKMVADGYGFKLKLRALAEAYIPEVVALLHDQTGTVAPSVKTDLFKYITKCGGLEPAKESSANNSSDQGSRITIQINSFTPDAPPHTVDVTPAPRSAAPTIDFAAPPLP